ncbi:MAG: hypothetical protein PHO89_07035 [Methylacidiphilaceae bacterium]|nr:hypothetical protein [Candidatus Methylacidiphilaceae bacterium]
MSSSDHSLPVDGSPDQREGTPVAVHSTVCHRDVRLAILGLGSLVRNSVQPLEIVFHDDGSLTEEDQSMLTEQLPVRHLWQRREADAMADELLARYPASRAFRYELCHGLKLLDTVLFEEGESVAYCDTDIFFLRRFRGLFSFPSPEVRLLLMSDREESYSARPWHLIGPDRLRLVRRINAGLYYLKKAAFDFDFIEWYFQRPWSRRRRILVEQTAWGALGVRVGCAVWDRRQVRIPTRRDLEHGVDTGVVALHFIGGLRGWIEPLSRRRPSRSDPAPVAVRTWDAKELTPLGLGFSQGWSKVKRMFGFGGTPLAPQSAAVQVSDGNRGGVASGRVPPA